MNGQRMHAAGKFGSQRGVDRTMPVDPALAAERFRHDIDPIVCFSARTMSGMTSMKM